MLIPVFFANRILVVEKKMKTSLKPVFGLTGLHRNLNFEPVKYMISLPAIFDRLMKTFVNTQL